MSEESQTPTPETPQPEQVADAAQAAAPVPGPGPAPAYTKEQTDKKLIAGILAIVLGWLGVHKFFLGYTVEGIIMLVIGAGGLLLCGIPSMIVVIIGIIEGILYLTKTDEEFVSTYVVGRKGWF